MTALLDRLSAAAWPALETERHDGWLLRASAGVTQRANSVLPGGPVVDLDRAIEAAESFAARHRIPAVFQVSPASRPEALTARLHDRGYRPADRTLVLTGSVGVALERLGDGPVVATAAAPSDAWSALWWSVDGRGDDAALAVARRILTGSPALFAQVDDPSGAVACGRLALAHDVESGEDWCGLYALATRPDARRRGHAATVVRSLLEAARERGVDGLWIQVLAGNAPALDLYGALGCVRASEYAYWRR